MSFVTFACDLSDWFVPDVCKIIPIKSWQLRFFSRRCVADTLSWSSCRRSYRPFSNDPFFHRAVIAPGQNPACEKSPIISNTCRDFGVIFHSPRKVHVVTPTLSPRSREILSTKHKNNTIKHVTLFCNICTKVSSSVISNKYPHNVTSVLWYLRILKKCLKSNFILA